MGQEKNDGVTSASRRKFVKNAAYVAPAILTLSVTPSFGSSGSGPSSSPEDSEYSGWWLRLLKLLGWI
jgi:hypothetical protein